MSGEAFPILRFFKLTLLPVCSWIMFFVRSWADATVVISFPKGEKPMNESNTYEQSNSITMDEAKRSLYQMSLIDDFLLTSTLTDKEDGRKAAEILLSTLLHQAIDVVDVIPQKVYNGIHRMRRGIRLDAYITARSSGENSTANIYDIEAETRYDDKKTLPQRSRYYSSLIDVHHLKTG